MASLDIKDVLGTGGVAAEIVKQVGDMTKEPISNLAGPMTKTLGQRLSDIFDLIYTPIEALKIYKDHKIEQFKSKLSEEIDKIPDDKRISPPLNIVGPALEASRFYVDNEMLRDMFAKLVARSMHRDISAMTHSSFVEIIKQLSPFDAEIISYFKQEKLTTLVDYVMLLPDQNNKPSRIPLISNIVLGTGKSDNVFEISNSITNLIRLGLIEKDKEHALGDYGEYRADDVLKQVKGDMSGFIDNSMIDFNRAIAFPTTYGKFFVAACV